METAATGVREFGKTALLKLYNSILAPMRARRLARTQQQRLSVVCYHRVDDTLKDNVTLPADSFDAQMAFIRKNFQVVSVEDIVAGQLDRASRRPIVAVTFDDGYLDNYRIAFPIVKKHRIPAAFFVSTGIVGTDRPFAHDLQRLGRALPAMTWDQLREMREGGCTIGSHTVTHINLAKAGEEEARRELLESRDAIRKEIGIREVAFAYCFGKRSDITPERRELVKAVGYTSCFAAYMGTNVGSLDLFDIKRFGVNWRVGLTAFEALIEGW